MWWSTQLSFSTVSTSFFWYHSVFGGMKGGGMGKVLGTGLEQIMFHACRAVRMNYNVMYNCNILTKINKKLVDNNQKEYWTRLARNCHRSIFLSNSQKLDVTLVIKKGVE